MTLIRQLFDLSRSAAGKYLARFEFPWQALNGLSEFLLRLGAQSSAEYRQICAGVWVHVRAVVAPSALLLPPSIVCEGAQIRTGALLRGSVLVGRGAVVGNATELKNAILFDEAKAPHFNYVGDGILGAAAHLGAGTICSNVRADKRPIFVELREGRKETGLKKCGAFVGDGTEVGCNVVLNPGTILKKGCVVYPVLSVGGVWEEGSAVRGSVVRP